MSDLHHALQTNIIYNEDCLLGMQRIPDGSVDMILCDLPYGTTECKWDSVIPFEPLWTQYRRVVKATGAILLTASQPFTTDLIISNPSWFKYSWVYEKVLPTGHPHAKNRPLKAHEDVLVFSPGTTVHANQSTSRMTYNPQMKPGKKRGLRKPDSHVSGYIPRVAHVGHKCTGMRYPRTVLTGFYDPERFAVSKGRTSLHPTQKPVALFEYLIRTYTNEGETVLDNCMGSGTTAIACLNTRRKYVGFEKDKTYFQTAQRRIAEHTVQPSAAAA